MQVQACLPDIVKKYASMVRCLATGQVWSTDFLFLTLLQFLSTESAAYSHITISTMKLFSVLVTSCVLVRGYGQPRPPASTSFPAVTIDIGEVIGTTTILPSATVLVNQFLGIPFAVSPPERFSPPSPAKPFSKPLLAQKWSDACIEQYNC